MSSSLRAKFIISFFLIVIIAGITATIISSYFIDDWSIRHAVIYFFGVLFVVVILALFSYFILLRSILKPLKHLSDKAEQLVEENLSSRAKLDLDNEMEKIEKAFNFIVLSLKERDHEIKEISKKNNENNRLVTLGQLAAGVAHEINNPLGGIVVYSNLLLEDTAEDDQRYSNIEKIIKESNRCKNIVKGLLDFARQSQPNLEPENIQKIIPEALNNIRREKNFEDLHIIENYGKNLPFVMVDASQIQEVFENIIRNAADVMKGSGELTITTLVTNSGENNRMINVHFADTGPGISPEDIDHIFEPFFTTKRKGHGTGLGMTVSYGIIERHEGTITVRNCPEGGAIFSVQLPVKEKE